MAYHFPGELSDPVYIGLHAGLEDLDTEVRVCEKCGKEFYCYYRSVEVVCRGCDLDERRF